MVTTMLDYRVKTFLTLCQLMNYRKTAEALNITQPGVTQHIQYLESQYGVKLFEYNGRTLTRTKNAEVLKKHLEGVMAQERAMEAAFQGKPTPPLRVGATKTIGEFVLLPTLESYLTRRENGLELMVDNTEVLLGMLEKAQLDFAIVEGVFDKTRFDHHLFRKERFLGVCGENHPFAGKRVRLEQVFQQALILREPGSGTRRLLEQAIADRGYSVECFARTISASSFSVITGLVRDMNAITFAYEPVARSREGQATFEVEDMQISGEFNFVYCSRETAMEQIRRLFS